MATNNWTNSLANGDGDDGLNWSLSHVPLATEDITITGSDDITFGTEISGLTFDLTGFSGSITTLSPTNGTMRFNVYGTMLKLVPGISFSHPPSFTAADNNVVNVYSGGYTFGQSRTNDPASGLTLRENIANTNEWNFAVINFGTFTLELNHDVNVSETYVNGGQGYVGAAITYSAGAKVSCKGTVGDYNSLFGANTWPPIENDGTPTFYSYENLTCQSFLQKSGALKSWFDTNQIDTVTTIGDFTILDGIVTNNETDEDQTGLTFNVGGDFLWSATSDMKGGVWNVVGTADCSSAATITDSDFSGGSALYAPNATDGGGNVNVVFGPPPPSGNQQLPGIIAVIASR